MAIKRTERGRDILWWIVLVLIAVVSLLVLFGVVEVS